MNKKIALVGIVGLLLVASAFAFAQGTVANGEGWAFGGIRHGMFGKMSGPKLNGYLGLSEDATMEEIKAAMLENLGLTEDSTKEEIMEAMKQQKTEMYEEKMEEMMEKLGLPSDATMEEVKEALQEWREENGVLCGSCQGKMKGKGFGPSFHMGFGPMGEGNCPFSE